MNLPNLIIIGAMKCGTVSLHKYLAIHPQIEMSPLKEVDYFVAEKNLSKGLDWYSSHFQRSSKVIGERSTNYAKYPQFAGVPERIHNLIPQGKIIYCVRDPIQRMISHYMHECARRREFHQVDEAFRNHSPNKYIEISKYYCQIKKYLEYFDPDQILILSSEEFYTSRREVLRKVFNFLNVDPDFDHPDYDIVHHRSRDLRRPTRLNLMLKGKPLYSRLYKTVPTLFERQIQKPDINESTRQHLIEIFQDDTRKLRLFTGEKFDTWCV